MLVQQQPAYGWSAVPMSAPLSPFPDACGVADVIIVDDGLQELDSATSNDVEMQDASEEPTKLYLVLDTNVLIDHLDVIKRLDKDIQELNLPVTFIIPNVLLSELDGLKKRSKIGWFASRASAWILAKAKERKTVHIQARAETCGLALAPHERERRNDMYIYDCCQFFAGAPDADGDVRRVVFVSGDVNLQNTVESLNTDGTTQSGGGRLPEIVTILPDRTGWSSRTLKRKLAECGLHIPRFPADSDEPDQDPSYQRSRTAADGRVVILAQDDIEMAVDDEQRAETYCRHALDALKIQAGDHFALLVKDLAWRVHTGAGNDVGSPANLSIHAPAYLLKEFHEWTMENFLEFLKSKLSSKRLSWSSSSLDNWLLRPELRGKECTRKAWDNAADALEKLGVLFQDSAILDSARFFKQEIEHAFGLRLYGLGE